MRQAAALSKGKLQLQASDSDSAFDTERSSRTASAEEESSVEAPIPRANPFGGLSSSEDNASDEEVEDDRPGIELGVLVDAEATAPVAKPKCPPKTKKEAPAAGASAYNIFQLAADKFDYARALETLSPGGVVVGPGSVSERNWLFPQSQLAKDVQKFRSGVRWIGYEPESEVYFRMTKVPGCVDEFDWLPTERYLSTWRTVEEFIGTAQLDEVFAFMGVNPYHPAANLCVAEYHCMQDQFDTAHQYLERALSAFQIGLSLTFRVDRFRSRARLHSLDLRRIARSLAVLRDDLVVDWDHADEAAACRKSKTREADVAAALSVPENGNLMFCKTLHMYALSLLQRGFARGALEHFRLVNMLTLGNDVAHSLLFVAEAAVRSRSLKIFEDYNQLYLDQTKDIEFKSVHTCADSVAVTCPLRTALIAMSFKDRLEALFPWFMIGRCDLMIRMTSGLVRDLAKPQSVKTALEEITADDFRAYLEARLAEGGAVDTTATAFTAKDCCMQMLLSVWCWPNFPFVLATEPQKTQLTASLANHTLFKQRLLGECKHEFGCPQLRQTLLEAYVTHSRDFWQRLYEPFVVPCALKMGQLHCLLDGAVQTRLVHEGLTAHMSFLDQYRGVRQSEFDVKKPVLADALLYSSTESVDTAGSRTAVPSAALANSPLTRWFRSLRDATQQMNVRENVALNFLHSLMPWARLSFA